MKHNNFEEVPSMQELVDSGAVDCVFISDDFWYGRCVDDGCSNLHVFMREEGRRYEVGAAFTCEQLEDMAHTARLILQRRKN